MGGLEALILFYKVPDKPHWTVVDSPDKPRTSGYYANSTVFMASHVAETISARRCARCAPTNGRANSESNIGATATPTRSDGVRLPVRTANSMIGV